MIFRRDSTSARSGWSTWGGLPEKEIARCPFFVSDNSTPNDLPWRLASSINAGGK
jgi:hypothetical protein